MPDCQIGGLMTLTEDMRLHAFSSFSVVHDHITKPTHLMQKLALYVDLIFSNKPNLVIDSIVHPSLHTICHHQPVHHKLNLNINFQLSYGPLVWECKKGGI